MPKSLDDKWIDRAIGTIRKYESIIGNKNPLQIVVVKTTGVPIVFFKPPGRIYLVPGQSDFEEHCLNAMATFWCHYEYERRKHNARLTLVPNTTAKPVPYPYGGSQWRTYRNNLRSKLFTV